MPSLKHQNPCDEEAQVRLPPMRQRPKPGALIEHPGEQRNKIHENITVNDKTHNNAIPKHTLKYPIVHTDTDDDYNLCYTPKENNNSQTLHIDCSLPLPILPDSNLQHLVKITLTNLPFQDQHLCPHDWSSEIPVARPLLPHRNMALHLLLAEGVVEWEDCPFEEWEDIPGAVRVDAKLRVWMKGLEGEVTKRNLEEVIEVVAAPDEGFLIGLGALIAAIVVVCVLIPYFPRIWR